MLSFVPRPAIAPTSAVKAAASQGAIAKRAGFAQLDGDPGVSDLVEVFGCSRFHFSWPPKQTTGLAPRHWSAEQRINKVELPVAENRLSLAEIALASGSSAQVRFTTAFDRETGTTWGQWRRASHP